MRRSSLFLASFVILALILSAAQEKPGRLLTWTPPEHLSPPWGSQIGKVVVVIHLSCKDQQGRLWDDSGTGFIVGYHPVQAPKDDAFLYLVTNRHVAECEDEGGAPTQLQSVSLQMNLKDGTSSNHKFVGKVTWYFPSDASVDLAVTTIVMSPEVDYLSIPLDLFFAREDFARYNIGEGARIILSGYSYHFKGETHQLPLVREGVLSMISDTPLQTTTHKVGRVYLGDVHIFGGNSGSPVFINTAGVRQDGLHLDDDYRLVGVISGFYSEDSDFSLEIATTVKATQHANSGISMIVPADYLKDLILNNPDLQRFRAEALAKVPR